MTMTCTTKMDKLTATSCGATHLPLWSMVTWKGKGKGALRPYA